MTINGFRRLALALPQSQESAHLDHPDFRVGKRVFATLGYPDVSSGMVKLTPARQAQFVAQYPQVFIPVKGGWGARGATNVKLRAATRATLWPAMVEAWRSNASATLIKQHPELDQ
jgi:hypothetical protein